ncbi:hypothetical protein NQZ79_g628 [Umbelopsis isabellina]|nr:hypothetical protein NQZ79_g628 [Umbelopsis isabellina]
MDVKTREHLATLITDITKTGEWIRYSSLQLIEELFTRSHKFRTLIADEFPQFLQLTIGIHRNPLPPPKNVASKLKEYAVALVKLWYEKYGENYRPFAIGYDYLISSGEANFEGSSLRDIRSRNTQMSRQDESCFEILVPKHDDGLSLEEPDGDVQKNKTSKPGDTYKDNILSHGLGSSRYTIEIDLSEGNIMDDVKESEENEIIFEKLRESYKIMQSKHLSKINSWLSNLVKIDADPGAKDDLLKRIINLKNDIKEAARKSNLLGIDLQVEQETAKNDSDDEDDFGDTDFEEVEVPDFENVSHEAEASGARPTLEAKKLPPIQRVFPLAHEPQMSEDATYALPSQKRIELSSRQQESSLQAGKGKEKANFKREELLKIAPVVEWGDDLYYWDKQDVQFNQSGLEYHHRFLGDGEGTNTLSEETLNALKMRAVYYKPEWPKKLKACRAPLKSGSLCPRRDLVTCPFHGPIIPRDEIGRPVDPKTNTPVVEGNINENGSVDEGKSEPVFSAVGASQPALWEELSNEVMMQQGIAPIESNKRGQKRKKKPSTPSALIDVRKKTETRMDRLQRRLEDPRMKRIVEESLDYDRDMKLRDKKANSWRGT